MGSSRSSKSRSHSMSVASATMTFDVDAIPTTVSASHALVRARSRYPPHRSTTSWPLRATAYDAPSSIPRSRPAPNTSRIEENRSSQKPCTPTITTPESTDARAVPCHVRPDGLSRQAAAHHLTIPE